MSAEQIAAVAALGIFTIELIKLFRGGGGPPTGQPQAVEQTEKV